MARHRAADDFGIIRQRMEELRLERDRALTRQDLGPPANGRLRDDNNRKDDARLLRSALLRKLVR